jgi:hypothetical protein
MTSRSSLIALLERCGAPLLDERQIGLFRLISAEVKRAPELAEPSTVPGRAAARVRWSAASPSMRGSGKLRIEDAGEAAGMLFGMAIGEPHMMMILGQREQPSPEEIAGQVGRAVEIFLRGTEPRRAGPD